MADPPRFEHGLQAPQAHVISRLHYGSNAFSTRGFCLTPTVCEQSHAEWKHGLPTRLGEFLRVGCNPRVLGLVSELSLIHI